MTKKCRRCERILPHSAFNKASHHRDGLASHCKACREQHRHDRRMERQAQRLAERAALDARPTKCCTGCHRELPRSNFPKKTKSRDGLAPQCKECKAQEQSVYRSTHGDTIGPAQQAWYLANRDRIRAPKAVDHIDPETTFKVCPRCEIKKPLVAFNRARSRSDGRRLECRDCQHQAHQDARADEASKIRMRQSRKKSKARYRLNHHEKYLAELKAWRDAHPEAVRIYGARRRARLKNSPIIDKIELRLLHKRDKGRCGLCHEKVNLKLRWPDPLSASVDHIIPLSKGGSESWANVVLAHLRCNMRKHNGSPTQQMRLF